MEEQNREPDFNSPPETTPPRLYGASDGIAALLCAALGWFFIKFALFNPFSLYPALFNIAFWVIALVYAVKNGEKVKRASHVALFAAAFIFNCAYFITSNKFTNFIAGTFAALLFAYMLFASLNKRYAFTESFPAEFLRSVITVPFGGFAELFNVVGYNARKSKSSGKIGMIMLGLIIGVPVTVVCGALLMSADDNFSELIGDVFSVGFREVLDFVVRFLFGIPVAAFLFGMIYENVKSDEPVPENKQAPTHVLPVYAVCSAVTPVCILYLIFFISHFAYLTSALFGSLHKDFSYADYARQGFFELCAVAVINLGIIVFLNLFDKKNADGKTAKGVKFFTLFITASTLILIITALGKMFLYIGRYGLTQLRVYTSWFMVLLFIEFIIILAKTIAPKIKMFRALFAVFAVMLSTLCFGDVDGMIANYNITAYQSGKLAELDVELFNDLSDSAVKYAIPLAGDEDYGNYTELYLRRKYEELKDLEFKDYNAESLNALRLLEEYFGR